MTAKRFTYEYDEYNGTLFDNKMNTFYHIEDSDENIEILCDRLNWLVEENEQLKSSDTITDLETGIMKYKLELINLKKENDQLKKEVEDLKQAVIRAAFGG